MKAIVRRGKKAVDLKLEDIEKPVISDDEILVRVRAGTVTRGDVIMRSLNPGLMPLMWLMGMKRPKVPGVEYSGVVEEVGKDVEKFKKGDKVFGTTTGLKYGANAEYVKVPEISKKNVIAIKPKNLTFEQAAAVPVGMMTAYDLLRRTKINKRSKVLINGASGSVGSYAVQIAQYMGGEVTAVCSKNNFKVIQSLGISHVVDYKKEDLTKLDKKFDVVYDTVLKLPKKKAKKILKEDGKYISNRMMTKEKTEYLELFRKWFDKKLFEPLISEEFKLKDVPKAHKLVESKHKVGNVVVNIFQGDKK